jgi:hypothetical protein
MLKPMNSSVRYFFGFSNGLATNQELGKLVGVPLFLRWRVRGSTRTLDFWFLEIAVANQRRCAQLEIFRNPLLTVIVTKSYRSVIEV